MSSERDRSLTGSPAGIALDSGGKIGTADLESEEEKFSTSQPGSSSSLSTVPGKKKRRKSRE